MATAKAALVTWEAEKEAGAQEATAAMVRAQEAAPQEAAAQYEGYEEAAAEWEEETRELGVRERGEDI